MVAHDTRQIPYHQIVASELNPRRHFDHDGLVDLAQSIAANGVLENLLVRSHPSQDGRFELIAGERRLRAVGLLVEDCRWGNEDLLPCRVIDPCSDLGMLKLALAENLARADMQPLEEAAAFRALIDAGMKTADIADTIGRTQRFVQLRLKLLADLTPEAQSALEEGIISAEQARVLTAASVGTQAELVESIRNGQDVTAATLKRSIRSADNLIPVTAAIFDRATYQGEIRNDGDEYFVDGDEFRALQRAAIDARAMQLREAGGHAFVKVCDYHVGQHYQEWDYERRPGPEKGTGVVIVYGHDRCVTEHHHLAPRPSASADAKSSAAPEQPAPAKVATKTHCAHARRRKTMALRRAIAGSPKAALRLLCLALMNSWPTITRIQGQSADADDGDIDAEFVAAVQEFVAPIATAADVGISISRHGVRTTGTGNQVAAWDFLASMSNGAIEDLLAHLVALHSASYVGFDPTVGDDPVVHAVARDLALSGHEADLGLALTAEDLQGLSRPVLLGIAREVAPESVVADLKAKALADFIVSMAPPDYVIPSLTFRRGEEIEAQYRGKPAP